MSSSTPPVTFLGLLAQFLGAIAGTLNMIKEGQDKMALTVNDLATKFAALQTTVTTEIADFKAQLAAIPTTDPATQAAIDNLGTGLDNLAATVKAADPGAPGATPVPVPDPTIVP